MIVYLSACLRVLFWRAALTEPLPGANLGLLSCGAGLSCVMEPGLSQASPARACPILQVSHGEVLAGELWQRSSSQSRKQAALGCREMYGDRILVPGTASSWWRFLLSQPISWLSQLLCSVPIREIWGSQLCLSRMPWFPGQPAHRVSGLTLLAAPAANYWPGEFL